MIEAEEEDTLRKILLEEWLHYLVYGTVTAEGVRVASYEWKDDTVPYTLVLPSRKTIPALKYIGSRTPPRYPNDSDYSAILKKSSSYRYNCHAFSWYFGGDVSGIANSDLLQIPDPKRFYKYGYSPYCVTEVGTPRKGDIVIYIPCSCQSEAHSQKKPVHSATILSVSGSTHNKIIVRSKWGIFGEYQHAISECPYYLSILPHGDSSCSPGRIEYYRPSHQFSSYKPLNTGFHNVICYCCGVISHKEPHSFIYSAGIYRCSKCGFKQVSPSSYEEE